MSKFDELDHRLGRHSETPNQNCPVCNPSAVNADDVAGVPKFWDYDDLGAPAFPDFGSIWKHRKEIVVFISAGGAKSTSGFWASPYIAVDHRETFTDTIQRTMYGNSTIQMEMGSGKWNPRVQDLASRQTLPSSDALRSPLGQDLPRWAEDQNRARLVAEIQKNRLFPITEITNTRWEDHSKDMVVIDSTVRVIRIPPMIDSYQMAMPF